MSLVLLPQELLLTALESLDIEDQWSLGLTCKQLFARIAYSDQCCRQLLGNTLRYSVDFRRAAASGAYAHTWRCLAKRRRAVRDAKPYQVALVNVPGGFTLCNDALISCRERWVHVLLLNNSGSRNIRLDAFALLKKALPSIPCCDVDKVNVLHQAYGIVTLLYQLGDSQLLVLFCDPTKGIILGYQSFFDVLCLFVRNDSKYLYCGHFRSEDDSGPRWKVQCYILGERRWLNTMQLGPHFAGCDPDKTVCFEIFDGHLYGATPRSVYFGPYTYNLTQGQYRCVQVIARDSLHVKEIGGNFKGGGLPVLCEFDRIMLNRDEKTGAVFFQMCRMSMSSEFSLDWSYKQVICPGSASASDDFDLLSWSPPPPIVKGPYSQGYDAASGNLIASQYDTASSVSIDLIRRPVDVSQGGLILRAQRIVERPRTKHDPANEVTLDKADMLSICCPWLKIWKESRPARHTNLLYATHTTKHAWNGKVFAVKCSAGDTSCTSVLIVSFDPSIRIEATPRRQGQSAGDIGGGGSWARQCDFPIMSNCSLT
ncbi:uncharacterized protein F5Z01DRAFT_467574 [Emericellopsis atlantica]|uniref:F-box domain-containing protein n=1 Tax=Emericellopsis atlantica TaxID=2614577 RepID=A0A9P7ZDH5_9HYPO|nr:uncharacterized protein F5Z01DRAFT_467574 [Emericellopsis atlantica]KAG9249726.1 hypothetical protein F5Z01DRAFT_467574 [Emericellopsis atlantica]